MPIQNQSPESQFAYVVVASQARPAVDARAPRRWWPIRIRTSPRASPWKNCNAVSSNIDIPPDSRETARKRKPSGARSSRSARSMPCASRWE